MWRGAGQRNRSRQLSDSWQSGKSCPGMGSARGCEGLLISESDPFPLPPFIPGEEGNIRGPASVAILDIVIEPEVESNREG